ncbi:hypothetical protein SAMN02745146_2985 [Hymenobacter daecheongensis DSM 21074]|uniref:Outer membrane protein beta-barrel family protein n=1 Tax=Hymenobacter daecheongensis DSM 21074 TaxID=1121955 RepID=A0A1M6IV70_9BACT|nr:DUF3575 domain-containing protein [Hymenobacter daecheongensis]SHJ38356.1 hypothetical protein SAMN02745146_2985 [Hymenobacter daecheongensis DSM 21074]
MPFSVESRVGYERVVSRQGSVAGSYSYLGTNYPFNFIGSFALSAAISSAFTLAGHPSVYWTDVRIRTQGYRYQLQYRHYLSATKPAPEGFYLAPHFSYTKADYDIRLKDFDTQVTINTTNRNYNLLLGFQHILGRHFVIDAFTGLGYRDKTTKSFDQNGKLLEALPKGTRLKLSSGLNLGWGF